MDATKRRGRFHLRMSSDCVVISDHQDLRDLEATVRARQLTSACRRRCPAGSRSRARRVQCDEKRLDAVSDRRAADGVASMSCEGKRTAPFPCRVRMSFVYGGLAGAGV